MEEKWKKYYEGKKIIEKEYDKEYDWWSADGSDRVVRVYGSEREITMTDWWHEYFFWEPVAKKQWHYNSKEFRRAKLFSSREIGRVFYDYADAPRNLWGGCVENLGSDSLVTDPSMSPDITILYHRDMIGERLNELADLQRECEALVDHISFLTLKISMEQEKLSKRFAFGKSAALKEKEEAEQELAWGIQALDQKMARVEELRQLILREQQNG